MIAYIQANTSPTRHVGWFHAQSKLLGGTGGEENYKKMLTLDRAVKPWKGAVAVVAGRVCNLDRNMFLLLFSVNKVRSYTSIIYIMVAIVVPPTDVTYQVRKGGR